MTAIPTLEDSCNSICEEVDRLANGTVRAIMDRLEGYIDQAGLSQEKRDVLHRWTRKAVMDEVSKGCTRTKLNVSIAMLRVGDVMLGVKADA